MKKTLYLSAIVIIATNLTCPPKPNIMKQLEGLTLAKKDPIKIDIKTGIVDASCRGIRGYNVEQILKQFLPYKETITELNFSDNDIEELPSIIGKFTELQRLQLHDNPISRLPFSIFKLKHLSFLSLPLELSINQFNVDDDIKKFLNTPRTNQPVTLRTKQEVEIYFEQAHKGIQNQVEKLEPIIEVSNTGTYEEMRVNFLQYTIDKFTIATPIHLTARELLRLTAQRDELAESKTEEDK